MVENFISRTAVMRRWLLPCVVLTVGFVFGSAARQPNVVQADDRRTPSRPAFQSGSERSITVLREIASTLKRMEGRIERIERSVTAKQRQQGN